jgi:hypothetical protein
VSKKLTRNTRVTTAYNRKADFWKFSASMIFPVVAGVFFGAVVSIIFQLDYIPMVVLMLWIPVTWAIAVGDKSPADFIESFQSVPEFKIKRRRRTKIFRR